MVKLVMYDIADDKKRAAAADFLIRSGFERLQYSVYACSGLFISDIELKRALRRLVNESEEDSVLIFSLSDEAFVKARQLTAKKHDLHYIAGMQHVLFF